MVVEVVCEILIPALMGLLVDNGIYQSDPSYVTHLGVLMLLVAVGGFFSGCNGSEFADLSELEKMADTLVYYAHPYTSCDKGTVERHNGLIRRFIPKGKRIDDFTGQQISDVETWCNCLPRKILGYRTPDEIFEEEIDRIYQATA